MAAKLDPPLRDWLNHSVYPHLSHDQVFGSLPGYTVAQSSETRYADCPRCHRKGRFFMLAGRHVGQCHCSVVISWYGFIRFTAACEAEAIERIAAMAGVPALRRTNPFRR